VVDRAGLENRCARKGTVGSNPTLSAIKSIILFNYQWLGDFEGLRSHLYSHLSCLDAQAHPRTIVWVRSGLFSPRPAIGKSTVTARHLSCIAAAVHAAHSNYRYCGPLHRWQKATTGELELGSGDQLAGGSSSRGSEALTEFSKHPEALSIRKAGVFAPAKTSTEIERRIAALKTTKERGLCQRTLRSGTSYAFGVLTCDQRLIGSG
jgi:hypothetical protein